MSPKKINGYENTEKVGGITGSMYLGGPVKFKLLSYLYIWKTVMKIIYNQSTEKFYGVTGYGRSDKIQSFFNFLFYMKYIYF